MYSGDLKSNHSKSGLLEVGFQMVLTIQKPLKIVDLVFTVLYTNLKNSLG